MYKRQAYVLANTIQQKDHDGRISRDCKEWAKGMDASPDHATPFDIYRIFAASGKVFAETNHGEYTLRLRLYEMEQRLEEKTEQEKRC